MSFDKPQKIDRAKAFQQLESVRRERRPQRAETEQRQEAQTNQQRVRDVDEAQRIAEEKSPRLNVLA